MEWKAKWLAPAEDMGSKVPLFQRHFPLPLRVKKAVLYITALGVYEARINGARVGSFILAPGWSAYPKRLQYQCYDVSELLKETNDLHVLVGRGWYRGRMPGWEVPSPYMDALRANPPAMLAQLEITYEDGSSEIIVSDESWTVSENQVRFSDIYDGEICDASMDTFAEAPVKVFHGPFHTLIPQEGEEIREQERIKAASLFVTPRGETVIDFGQNLTGYVEVSLDAEKGQVVDLSFAEVMDKEGNFYTENYRSAKAEYHYTCCDGPQTYKPHLCFYGFRYIRVNEFPGGIAGIDPACFTAIAVHSQIRRTGYLNSSSPQLNQLFHNIIWGQKGNFVDVPTDCPQRDERLGWTGDAQVFVRTACLNYDCEKFFTKWLADLAAEQGENGYIGHVIPNVLPTDHSSAAWGDAAVICPWEVYLAYGNPGILKAQFHSMKKWVDYITATTSTPNLWIGGVHYGDWLGLDAPTGSYRGSSRDDFIASAFYAHSTWLVIKAGKVLGEDVSSYENLYGRIVAAFREEFPVYETQTECVLAVHFGLAPDLPAAAGRLAEMIVDAGTRLMTGFVGTPYILHVLSDYGYMELAYSLLLREEYPSWLYPITKGATTIWEHWDGIMENGDMWSADMNSFNHYAYGSVADWVYSVAAGITRLENHPGYEEVRIAPNPDTRLDWLEASLDTRHGKILSRWKKKEDRWEYEITTPVPAEIIIDGNTHTVASGSYVFYSEF